MRAIWKGAITFGLVSVPVKVYSATEDHDVRLHQVHDKDGGRIRYQRRCDVCGQVVAYEHIDKAFEEGGETVLLTKEELSALPAEKSREIDVVEFVPTDQLDPLTFGASYFLEPEKSGLKAYALLRRTLAEKERTAVVRFALRQKTRLGALRVRGDVLVLQSLLWADEVREAAFPVLEKRVQLSERELEMSAQLVKGFESDFDPSQYGDEYQAQLRALIAAKRKRGESVDTEETFGERAAAVEERGGEVVDLMEALKKSVEARRARSGGKKTAPRELAAKQVGEKRPRRKKGGSRGA